ncbi:aryl-sulfate sulfotransferase [uncultured Lacinutrix sp.]|uniref:aryl-sulfate sulfotransferase n=1 Tax=uncultured Lacinutrix sp. TaxID=574032 RepID=UPI002601B331|nr:aryl-sulfate sulfotransferase [uncultured Lacinutrix sp.]
MKKFNVSLLLFLLPFFLIAQNTVGIILNPTDTEQGYTLFSVHTKTFLINDCGEVINEWQSVYPPGNAVYLLENGTLLRAGKTDTTSITLGGVGGAIELFDWDGNILWSIEYDSPSFRQHHDIFPMPNGNVLVLAATIMSETEAIQEGRDPNLINNGQLYNEQIVEIEPVGINQYNVVWEWNVKDHLIQDFDPNKNNYGTVSLEPGKLNINFLNNLNLSPNWLHFNSIQYNEQLDQILISSRKMSEIYIIDHSTTTTEAATSSGGIYNRGGDFLYRWGNPQAYNVGTEVDRKLYGQHYPHWIPDGFNDAGKIILFNNGAGRTPEFSEVFVLNPPIDSNGNYNYTSLTSYLPNAPDYIYTNSDNFYSAILSSAQRLPNGNTLICEGRTGEIIEINANNDILWKYIVPVNNTTGQIFSTSEAPVQNSIFRAIKYTSDYSAFIGKDLTPNAPIEINPSSTCSILGITSFNNEFFKVKVLPNPTKNVVIIESSIAIEKTTLFSITGQKLLEKERSNVLNLSNYKSGIYILKIHSEKGSVVKQLVKN